MKLTDFGCAGFFKSSKLMNTQCGTPPYISPDVLSGKGYTEKCDLWSMGVIIWMLLIGRLPFRKEKDTEIMKEIRTAELDWSDWVGISQDAKDLVEKLLVRDRQRRIDAKTALQHRWLTSTEPEVAFPVVSGSTVRSMQRFAAGPKLRRAALKILVRQLDWQETRRLREAWFDIDQDCKGWISLQSLKDAMQELEALGKFETNPDEPTGLDTPEHLFAALDTNCDHRIYYSEFMAATVKVCPHLHKHAFETTFMRLDADSSGSIGISDLHAAMGNTIEDVEVAEVLREACPRGGELCFPEFLDSLTLRRYNEDIHVVDDFQWSSGKDDKIVNFLSPKKVRRNSFMRERIATI